MTSACTDDSLYDNSLCDIPEEVYDTFVKVVNTDVNMLMLVPGEVPCVVRTTPMRTFMTIAEREDVNESEEEEVCNDDFWVDSVARLIAPNLLMYLPGKKEQSLHKHKYNFAATFMLLRAGCFTTGVRGVAYVVQIKEKLDEMDSFFDQYEDITDITVTYRTSSDGSKV